ncbi:MFS transporter [Paraburkholderia sp. BL25I1N1]|uniref:MFS transporter n=1 Tax=Paraburkholderia sp. BL25I1N1 TaxID=1938804 RepID=UPI000D055728|nr:MFS transporter [Paraburkholderia sp. BL25I1N1]PRX96464.1 sugar phosphate permease [Paraburkholderia sp. BL25I1N1]
MKLLQNRWFILFALLMPLNFLYGFDRNALSVTAHYVQNELSIDFVLMSEILVISTAVYACMQVPAGWLAQKLGVRWVLAGACFLWSAATAMTALQTHVPGFFAARILLGIGQAPDWVACILALKLLFPETEREDANALLLAAAYTGVIVSGAFTPWMVEHSSWRYCFTVYGLVGVALGLLVLVFYRGKTREVVSVTEKLSFRELRQIDIIWKIAQAATFYGTVCVQHGFFLITFPHFATSMYHVTPVSAGSLFSILWGALYLSVLFWGALIKYLKRRGKGAGLYGAPGRAVGVLAAGGFLAAGVLTDNIFVGMTLLSGSMFALGLCQILAWARVQTITGATGIAAGFTQFAGNGCLAIGPVVFEMLYKHYTSWTPVTVVAVTAALIGGALWLRPDRPGKEAPSTSPGCALLDSEKGEVSVGH